jgi:hypothetical protein
VEAIKEILIPNPVPPSSLETSAVLSPLAACSSVFFSIKDVTS